MMVEVMWSRSIKKEKSDEVQQLRIHEEQISRPKKKSEKHL